MKRLLTALALIPVITYTIIWSPPLLFAAVLCAVGTLCFVEYRGLAAAHGMPPPTLLGVAAGLAFILIPGEIAAFITLAVLLAMAVSLRSNNLRDALPQVAGFALGLIYCYGPWRCCLPLRVISPYWLFCAVAINWVGDSAAMYVGRAFGRHKLAPVVSPGKTWEGALASVAAAIVFGVIFIRFTVPETPIWLIILVAAVANAVGQLGDLCESAFKRGAGVKDSGTLLPGHGGWLDRVDSTMFAVPAAYGLLVIAQRAGIIGLH